MIFLCLPLFLCIQTWLGSINETVKLCNSIQYLYWCLVINVPDSCPKLTLLCENKSIDMKFCIWNEKCQLLVRIKRLEEDALAKQVYKQAEEKGWPGLGEEVRYICEKIQIPDINKYDVQKKEIQVALFDAHYSSMIQQLENSNKLKDIIKKTLDRSKNTFMTKTCIVLDFSDCKVEMTHYHGTNCPSRASLLENG